MVTRQHIESLQPIRALDLRDVLDFALTLRDCDDVHTGHCGGSLIIPIGLPLQCAVVIEHLADVTERNFCDCLQHALSIQVELIRALL